MNDITVIQNKIYEIRGLRVMLDFDLAALYGVETRTLKQAVRRNIERFPEDFMLQLSSEEANYLINIGRSQNVIPPDYNVGAAGMFAFTEEGVAMLSGVLRSKSAVQANIAIMRAFVAMRNYIATTTTVTAELAEIRAKLALLERADEDNAEAINDLSEDMRKELDNIYQAIAALSIKTPQARKQPRPIGYKK
ncbi:ORF6N domain-containing protein [uncultured Alistipes sp.]|uniref:ORF6N domain-containing protein n=1 Tax=uncultured Alistipes sp. TaxID=538949 RepID=UPI0026031F86|nr:ORF6N domain-containing protein [uncultured Alistipes sp.]